MLRKLTGAVRGAAAVVVASLHATVEAFDSVGDVDLGPLDEPHPGRPSNPALRAAPAAGQAAA